MILTCITEPAHMTIIITYLDYLDICNSCVSGVSKHGENKNPALKCFSPFMGFLSLYVISAVRICQINGYKCTKMSE